MAIVGVDLAEAATLRIRGARLAATTMEPARPSVDVTIDGDRIVAIDEHRADSPSPPETKVIDAAGLTLLPGLIDSHVHFVAAPGTAVRGDSDETIAELNRHHLRGLVAAGVTTVLDAGAYPETVGDLQQWLAAGHPGPRYLTTGPYVRPVGGYGHPRFGEEATPAQVEAKLDLIQSLGGAGVKIGLEEGFAGPIGGPRPFPPEVLAAVREGAQKRGLPLYVHARTESTQGEAIDLGARAIMHAAFDVAQPAELSEEFVARLGKSGVYQLTTLSALDTIPGLYDRRRLDDARTKLLVPALELETARAPDAERRFQVAMVGFAAPWTFEWARPWLASFFLSRSSLEEALAVGQRNLLRVHRAGAPIVAATDVPSPWPEAIYHFYGPQMARELELLVEAGLSPTEALAAATSTPARMLGLADEIGAVEVGKRADLVLVAGEPDRDIAATERVRWTVKGGVARTPEEWMSAP
jgi:imidazolonepropionase-like amidohydrolase